MSRMPLRVLIVSVIVFLLGYLTLMGYSVVAFAPEEVDFFFRRGWIADNTLILFSRSFLVLHGTAVLLTFSLFFRPRQQESQPEPFYKMVRFSLILFLVMTGIGFLLQEMAIPRAEDRQAGRIQKTGLAREYKEEANREERAGQFSQALEALKRTAALIPGEAQNLQDRMETLTNRMANGAPAAVPRNNGDIMGNMSPRELLIQAQRFEDREDLFSAYYYSSLAYRIDPSLGDARAMASRIWSRLGTLTPHREDRERREIFDRKKRERNFSPKVGLWRHTIPSLTRAGTLKVTNSRLTPISTPISP